MKQSSSAWDDLCSWQAVTGKRQISNLHKVNYSCLPVNRLLDVSFTTSIILLSHLLICLVKVSNFRKSGYFITVYSLAICLTSTGLKKGLSRISGFWVMLSFILSQLDCLLAWQQHNFSNPLYFCCNFLIESSVYLPVAV